MLKTPSLRRLVVGLLVTVSAVAGASAQLEETPHNLPDAIPPPLPPPEAPVETETRDMDTIVPDVSDADVPWGLPDDLLAQLRSRAVQYETFARSFTCDETVRWAEYDGGEVGDEKIATYAYLLINGPGAIGLRESRQQEARSGELRPAEAEVEPFPPAYAWVFLFSEFHEPYFAFRKLATRFDGFDLVHEIQFRGALSFTDGRDIRQWEGVILVDAFKLVPIELRAEPKAQRERLEQLYRAWAQSFNIMGFRTGKTPLGYRAGVQFRYGHPGSELNFPTELRYDTFRATSPSEVVPIRASTRTYEDYRFFRTQTTDEPGEIVPQR